MSRSNGAPRKHPTAWLYLLAFLLPIGGCAGTIGMLVGGIDSLTARVAALPRAAAPGVASVELPAGNHELFYETRGEDSGLSYQTNPSVGVAAPVDCALTDASGAEVTLALPHGHTSYSVKGRTGHSIYRVEIGKPGSYRLSCTPHGNSDAAAGTTSPGDQIVFVGSSLLTGLVKLFVPMVLGVVAGISMFLAVFFMRRRSVA
jgi:hypothetical protein